MSLREFILENRDEIDEAINSVLYHHNGIGGRGVVPSPPPERDNTERAEWIMNDESLYNWARSEGVRI